MGAVLSYSLQLVLGIVLPWWVVRRDQRRLGADELARTWNEASFWSAIVAFGPFCIPVHFYKAHRSLRGLVQGALWMIAVFAVMSGCAYLLDELAGIH